MVCTLQKLNGCCDVACSVCWRVEESSVKLAACVHFHEPFYKVMLFDAGGPTIPSHFNLPIIVPTDKNRS